MIPRSKHDAESGFTLAELLVVIAIVVLLLGILVPVLGGVRKTAAAAASQTQLSGVASACRQYKMTFNAYPGYVSDRALADGTDEWYKSMSGTENLLISLMGPAVPIATATTEFFSCPALADTNVKVNLDKFGHGPIIRSGRQYGAFYTPQENELGIIETPDAADSTFTDNEMPELLDARTGVPILYYRGNTGRPLAAADDATGPNDASFYRYTNSFYTDTKVKTPNEEFFNQRTDSLIGPAAGVNAVTNFAWTLVNPTLSDISDGPNSTSGDVVRGSIALIAPGWDGIYFSKFELDDAGTVTTISDLEDLEKFDDILEFVE